MRLQLFAAVMTLALFAGCATEKPSGRMQDVIEARATVTAIDRPHRLVTLRDESGLGPRGRGVGPGQEAG